MELKASNLKFPDITCTFIVAFVFSFTGALQIAAPIIQGILELYIVGVHT